jgi:hypothetical protein
MANRQDMEKIFKYLIGAYPNFSIPDVTLEVYAEFLKDLDADVLEEAIKMVVVTCKFFPSIAEIRSACADLVARSTGLPSAIDAWGEVLEKIHRYGNTRLGGSVPEFSHPLIANLVRRFGWNDLCLSENEIADRARFLEAYEHAAKEARTNVQILPETHQAIENMARVSTGVQSLVARLNANNKRQ